MAYNLPTDGQDPWYANLIETLDYLKTTAEGAATTAGTKKTDSMSTNKLLGRGTGGTGAIEEITLGTNLSLTGTTLNAAGGGGGGGDMLAATYDPLAKAANAFSQDNMVDGTTNKNYSATDKTKLAGIASAATANSADATLLARANHTGTQLASTVSDFSTAADARVAAAVGISVQAFDTDLTAFAAKTAPTGAVVGTTDAQTLTTKTISGASNTLSNISADSTIDGTTNKAFLATERAKLSGIATAATANSADATLLARANHTGTQALTTITGFLTNTTTATSGTPAATGDARNNELFVTALAANATFSAPSGTPADGNRLLIRVKDNATSRTLAWNAIFRAVGIVLPTATTVSKTLYIGGIYNSADSKWDMNAMAQEA